MAESLSSSGSSSSAVVGDGVHGVRLTRSVSDATPPAYAQRLVVTADRARNMPAEIFRYAGQNLKPADATDPAGRAYALDGVCGPADLEQFAVGFPEIGSFPAYCRRDTIDVVVRAASIAAELWDHILEEVTTLVNTLDTLAELQTPETFAVGLPEAA